MSHTIDLYYDSTDTYHPFCLAASGQRCYGEAVISNVLDNGWQITGEETDGDLEDYAHDCVYRNGDCLQVFNYDDGEGDDLSFDLSYEGLLMTLKFVRDEQAEDAKKRAAEVDA